MPLIPLLLVLAARTTAGAVHALRRREWGAVVRLAAPAALAALVTTSDWVGIRDPDVAEQHYSLGNRYAVAEAYERAVAEYEATIRERPYHMGAWNNIGTVRLRQGRLGEARRVLEQSLAIQETAEAHARIGMAYLLEGQLDSAGSSLERSLALMPDNPEALYYLGTADATRGDLEGAISAWERALRLHPDPSYRENLYYALGKLYIRSGRDSRRGGELLSRLSRSFPDLEQLKAEALKETASGTEP